MKEQEESQSLATEQNINSDPCQHLDTFLSVVGFCNPTAWKHLSKCIPGTDPFLNNLIFMQRSIMNLLNSDL